jgi:hypothetical protein
MEMFEESLKEMQKENSGTVVCMYYEFYLQHRDNLKKK